MRVGIATGPVVVGDIIGEGAAQESAVVGETPNLAARLQSVAEPNSVIISATTEALTAGLFELEALPARTLKGFSDEVTLYRVQAEVRGQSRFAARSGRHLSPFVGREEELELLARRWIRTKAGRGQVVLTVGEAGIGKSRLLQQLREHIGTEPHAVIALQCSPYHESSALYPSIAAFERALGFSEVVDGARRLKALQLHLEEIGETGEQPLGLSCTSPLNTHRRAIPQCGGDGCSAAAGKDPAGAGRLRAQARRTGSAAMCLRGRALGRPDDSGIAGAFGGRNRGRAGVPHCHHPPGIRCGVDRSGSRAGTELIAARDRGGRETRPSSRFGHGGVAGRSCSNHIVSGGG